MRLYSNIEIKAPGLWRGGERGGVSLAASTHSGVKVFHKIKLLPGGFSGKDPAPLANWLRLRPALGGNRGRAGR